MLSVKDEKFIALATYYASLSSMYFHHGCVISLKGNCIAHGFNHERTYSKDRVIENCVSCHAEMSALRTALKRCKRSQVNKLKVYVVRISGNSIVNSKPCEQCYLTLKKHGIKKIIYSQENDFASSNFKEDTFVCMPSSGYINLLQ